MGMEEILNAYAAAVRAKDVDAFVQLPQEVSAEADRVRATLALTAPVRSLAR